MKSRCAVNSVAVEQRYGRHLQFRSSPDQTLRLRCAFKKAERTCGMKLDVLCSRISHTSLPSASDREADRG
jgi:hypothetical protein